MFLLELASLQTPLPFSQQSTAAITFADIVCVYINIHTHMLYTYIYISPPSSAHRCYHIKYTPVETEHLTLSFSFRISEGIRQSALAIRGTMLTFSCRAFMNSTSTGLSLQQGQGGTLLARTHWAAPPPASPTHPRREKDSTVTKACSSTGTALS